MRGFKQSMGVVLVVYLALTGCTGCEPTEPGDGLIIPVDITGTQPAEEEWVIRTRGVKIDPAALRVEPGTTITVELFEDVVRRVVLERREQPSETAVVWHGTLEGEPGSAVTLVLNGEVLIGNISTMAGRHFQIRYLEAGVHYVQEVDRSRYPDEADPEEVELDPLAEADTCSTDPASDIDVLIAYTQAARIGAGGTEAMEAEAFLAVAETNESYANSNVSQRLRLAYLLEVTYTESGNSTTDKTALQSSSDGVLDNLHTLRDTYAADLVVLITNTLDWCGEAYIMSTVSNAFQQYAFGVIKRSCATGNYSFGHELGHIMGARHDWYVDPTNNSPYVYNHAHLETAPTATGVSPWRTIMGYNSGCAAAGVSCTRLRYWSNPFVTYPPGVTPNDAMGVATGSQQEDNHKALNNTALTVANFRCSSPDVDNVWMKDTWNDTGKEPDPATAAEAMHKSPYIWARAAQDTALIHQHQHQNPVQSSPSHWVYVKVHNGSSTAATGNLEIYWANASTSLSWPTGWTLLGSVPVTGFTGNSTRIVEKEWTSLPSAGHYCLLARWVSTSDPMATPEGTSISANVRANNNLVWRNLDVVPLGSDEPYDASFAVTNDAEQVALATLLVQGPREGRRPSFLPHGEVVLAFSESMAAVFQRGGMKGSGFERVEEGYRIADEGASFEGLQLPAGFKGNVYVRIRRLPTTPGRDFEFDVLQLSGDTRVGGVSYEVRTDVVER